MRAMARVHATKPSALVLISEEMVARASFGANIVNTTVASAQGQDEGKLESIEQLEFLEHVLGEGGFGKVFILTQKAVC